MKCAICGAEDLFSAVARQPACSICVLTFALRTPIKMEQVELIRSRLGLEPGSYLTIEFVGDA